MAISIPNVLRSASRYAARNPRVLGEIARYAFQRRIAIPLDSLRWLVHELPAGKKAPKDITLAAQPPALGLGLTVDVMGTELRLDVSITIDAIDAGPDRLQVTLRARDLRASVLNNLDGNLAKLLKSGFIDLGKPAAVLNNPMLGGKKPKAIIEAEGDRFVLDLLQIDKVANNPAVQRALATLTPVLSVNSVRTEGDLLLIGLTARPSGIRESFSGLRS